VAPGALASTSLPSAVITDANAEGKAAMSLLQVAMHPKSRLRSWLTMSLLAPLDVLYARLDDDLRSRPAEPDLPG
jgi:hypothetical protein